LSTNAPSRPSIPADGRIAWLSAIPFIGMHFIALGVFRVGWSPAAVFVCLALYWVRMFAITGFYHRYLSHRSYKTSRWFQFLFAVLGNSSTQKGPLWWAAHHRHHHQYSDDDEDVHSPTRRGFFYSHVGWIFARSNAPTRLRLVPDLAKFPELRALDRFDVLIPILLGTCCFGLGVLLEAEAPSLGTSGVQMLVWGFFLSTVLLAHSTFTINSLSHLVGRRRFQTTDTSRNNLPLALLTMGEGWHNNHHFYPTSTRQGFYWWEIDATYYGLYLLSKLGLIWDLKRVPAHILEQGRLSGEARAAAA
jgi:stearoyl-CoA desaturase (Delta-9 desaturase)